MNDHNEYILIKDFLNNITEENFNAFAKLTVCDKMECRDNELIPHIKEVWVPCYFYEDDEERIYIKYFSNEYMNSSIYIYNSYDAPVIKHVC